MFPPYILMNTPPPRIRLALILAVLCLSSCLRYTPSYKELREKYDQEDEAPDSIGGEQEFTHYENSLRNRLDDFLRQRSYLLSASASSTGYPVGSGDLLAVDVYGFGNLSSQAPIGADGSVALPLVGKAVIAGLTLDEVRDKLAAQYARFIRAPQVQVSLKSAQASRVSVMGEVSKPGLYPLSRRGVLVTEILSEAGGRTPNAGGRIVVLPAPRIMEPPQTAHNAAYVTFASQPPPDGQTGVEIDLEDLVGQVDQRPLLVPLLPGDTIIVPEAGTYEVDGEVVQPGSYKLSSRTSVIGAIAAAKGFSYAAAVNNVEVIRDTGGGKKALITLDLEEVGLRGGRDIRLRSGDLVRVPSEPNRFFKRQIIQTINGLFNGVGVSQRIN